jgi:hypothetical protein
VRVFVDVQENDAVLVTPGAPAVVTAQALKGETFPGVVCRSSFALDPRSKTLRTEIDLKNRIDPKTGEYMLRPGMYAFAVITVEHAGVLALPAAAVVTHGEQSFCFRVEGGKAVRMPIQVGFRDARFVEALKKQRPGKEGEWENFTGNEMIIAGGAAALSDGQAVNVTGGP